YTSINETLTPTTYYSTRLDVYDIYGRCNEKKIPYTILDSQGEVVTGGILDEDGRTARVYRETEDKLKVLVGHAQVLDWL
ncbi:hypothetical protein FXB78_10745, partial [Aggregatibacter actinomycetemcomitans]